MWRPKQLCGPLPQPPFFLFMLPLSYVSTGFIQRKRRDPQTRLGCSVVCHHSRHLLCLEEPGIFPVFPKKVPMHFDSSSSSFYYYYNYSSLLPWWILKCWQPGHTSGWSSSLWPQGVPMCWWLLRSAAEAFWATPASGCERPGTSELNLLDWALDFLPPSEIILLPLPFIVA